jgi:integrase/recombinase XerD
MAELPPARVTGPLAAYAEGFGASLLRRGYTERTARDGVYVLAHLSRWLCEEGLETSELRSEELERFLLARRTAGYRRGRSAQSLRPLLGYLREIQVIPPAEPSVAPSPLEELLDDYGRYLRIERRLAPTTVRTNEDVARRFLSTRARSEDLTPFDVTGFVVGESRRYSTGSMKVLTTALRSLLRFLFLTGRTSRDLTSAVPAVAHWQKTSLPTAADGPAVEALLQSCDRSTTLGRRDFAILTLLARLGLRAGEVASVELDDVDWRTGQLRVRGKGNRLDCFPLPHDVGEALADYLSHGRPASKCRALFLRGLAPEGAISARAVVMVPRSASHRAGIPVVGAHRLRHAAATSMLRNGASLLEIAQVLRHNSESTTKIYASVDRATLERVVRPWSGARR